MTMIPINDAWIMDVQSFGDERGTFAEIGRQGWFKKPMVQTNLAKRVANSLVGLHYHVHQSDFWWVAGGEARVVLHDLRKGSTTEGVTYSMLLAEDSNVGVYIPPGVAHGFLAITDLTLIYQVDEYYDASDEHGVAWDDPEINAHWGPNVNKDMLISNRDRINPLKKDLKVLV